MAARKVSTAMFRMPFRREEEEPGPGWLVVWALAVPPQVTHMSPTRTSLHCCKIWQQMAGDCCLSKRIISPLSGLLREAALLLSLTISAWYTDNSTRLQMHPGIYKQPDWLTLKTRGSVQQGEREEHQCQNVNEKDLLRSQKRGRACRTVREGNLKWILKQFVWFCCVAKTLERAFPSVLLSPWPVSASLVRLSHLSSCYGTSPLRPCHRPQRARPYHQSHRWATRTTGTSLQWWPEM